MTFGSEVKIPGSNKGIDVPIVPSTSPSKAPMITSDFSSIRACLRPRAALSDHILLGKDRIVAECD